MKKFKSGKKVFSAIAALAISATAVGGILSVIKLNGNDSGITIDNSVSGKTVVVDTVYGATRSLSGNTYYTAPDASGRLDAAGTADDPFRINDILSGSTNIKLEPGDTLYVLPGTYVMNDRILLNKSTEIVKGIEGKYNQYLRIVNAALEGADYNTTKYPGTQAVLDFSGMEFNSLYRGVSINSDYIYWYGVDICGAGDNGMYIGGSYNTIEYSEFYNNRDTGLQLGRAEETYASIYQWPSYNLVKNCTSHNNYDNQTFGENADGFAAKLTVGFGNVFDGCVAYRNSDDGWDLYAKTDSGNIGAVILYNCVAFENGYLEYTRDECNSLFPKYDKTADYETSESSKNPYMTRDGDGNGFKLGGSIMEGDVVLYNCLAFNNRMHGVTDNSNPGYIKSTYVTSYNNSAMVDENGRIAAVANSDTHSNIDLSRQTYSYNSVNNVLSVRDNNALSLDTDNYRGTVTNSLLDAGSNTNIISGSLDADTINGGRVSTKQIDALAPSNLFEVLPNNDAYEGTLRGNADSMIINIDEDGHGTIVSLKDERVHLNYRNADHSINMKDIMAITDEGAALIKQHLDGTDAGSTLNYTSWDKYVHFYENDLVNGSGSEDKAWADRAAEALTINTVEGAVYQDFEVPVKMLNATIEWSTTDTEYLNIKDELIVSDSGSEYVLVEVWRDSSADKDVTLTAKITYGSASVEKEFKLTLKKGSPSIGTIYVEDDDGIIFNNEEKYVVDRFEVYPEPAIRVQNGLYPDSNKLLKEDEYTVKTTYKYQPDGNAYAIDIKQFTPSVPGVYTITHEVSIIGQAPKTMTYKLYISSPDAEVAFIDDASEVTVNRGGFAIAGNPSSATGILYAVSSATELELTADTVGNIKNQAGVTSYSFRDTAINFNFENENTDSYHVYYALANANGVVTSKLYTAEIKRIDINTKEDFAKVARGSKLAGEEPSQTIYALTKDIDCAGASFSGTNAFKGVFNGLGHTLSNLSNSQGIFAKVEGGTIMNLKVDGLTIDSTAQMAGFVMETLGGEFYNLALTNVSVKSTQQRVGGLIGMVRVTSGKVGRDLTISQVSIVNPIESDSDPKIEGSQRAGGLIGLVQKFGYNISIDNCQVISNINTGTSGESGGIVGTWEDLTTDKLVISQCYYAGQLKTSAAPGSSRLGGMLGYHKGGAGNLTISRCISLATLHIAGVLRDVSVKNASPIVGNSSSSQKTVVSVSYCIGLMEEYNTDFDVSVFTLTSLKRSSAYLTSADYLMLDMTRWEVVSLPDDEKTEEAGNLNDSFKAPYVLLKFIEV